MKIRPMNSTTTGLYNGRFLYFSSACFVSVNFSIDILRVFCQFFPIGVTVFLEHLTYLFTTFQRVLRGCWVNGKPLPLTNQVLLHEGSSIFTHVLCTFRHLPFGALSFLSRTSFFFTLPQRQTYPSVPAKNNTSQKNL